MENLSLAWMLQEIADLLELKGENLFKIRAYNKAARSISELAVSIKTLDADGKLGQLTGIGKALEAKIHEYVATGSISYLEQLHQEIPRGLLELLHIPGVGPKMVQQFYQQLGVTSLDDLETVAKARRIRGLKGMGTKTELSILRGIERHRSGSGRISLSVANQVAQLICMLLEALSVVERVEIAGSIRRFRESCKDLDFVVASTSPLKVIEVFTQMPLVAEIIVCGDTKASVRLKTGFTADLRVVAMDQFYCTLHYLTGSKEHNVVMRQIAQKQGMHLSEYALIKNEVIPITSEVELYKALGLSYIAPELREDRGEILAAQTGKLPKLISRSDILADLHMHTTYSDGIHSISEMAEAAKKLGFTYIAICDHSQALSIANGLSEVRLRRQMQEIKQLCNALEFPILCGTEVDILADGSLDFDDRILAELDIVVASIHSGFQQDKDKLTDRIIQAIKNPHVSIIAHPTGRIIGHRQPYDLDMELIMQAAFDYGKILEINATPDRLDLSDVYARMAKARGVKLAINTDAHSVDHFRHMDLGVGYARRAWLEPEDVVNTWSIQELQDFLGRNT